MTTSRMAVRKITIGPDYKDGMHYLKGSPVMNGSAVIHEIIKQKNGDWVIWVKKEGEIMRWKTFENMPASIEHDLNF
jgi:hypothetical protein